MPNKDVLYILRCWLGVAGISHKESKTTQLLGRRFEFGMLIIALWLPIAWYTQTRALLPNSYFTISNWIIWLAFFAETAVMTFTVKHKFLYLTTNWLNLLIIFALFPLFWPHFYLATIVRVMRVCLMFRFLIPWLEFSTSFLARNHIGTTILVAVLLTTGSGLIIATFDPGIPNAEAGIWWAWQTITSVGYGDVVPVTFLGRLLAIFVMLFAIGLLAVLTANFSAFFIERGEKSEKRQLQHILDALARLEQKVDDIENKIIRPQKKSQ